METRLLQDELYDRFRKGRKKRLTYLGDDTVANADMVNAAVSFSASHGAMFYGLQGEALLGFIIGMTNMAVTLGVYGEDDEAAVIKMIVDDWNDRIKESKHDTK